MKLLRIISAFLVVALLVTLIPMSAAAASTAVVSFEPNGGTMETMSNTAFDGELTEANLPTPKRDGYVFTGWYTDSACTKPIQATSAQSDAITLYAGWYKIKDVQITGEDPSPAAGTATGFDVAGVQVRYEDGGLRFVSRIGRSLRKDVAKFFGEDARYGAMLALEDGIPEGTLLEASEKNTQGQNFKKFYSEKNFYACFDYTLYTQVITNITVKNYDTAIATRPFVEYKDASGITRTYYYTEDASSSHYLAGGYAISLYGLAKYIVEQTQEDEAHKTQLTDNIITPYDEYLKYSDDGDNDSDGLTNSEEYIYGTDKNNVDTDSDGLTDYEEIIMCYDPLSDDTDSNGVKDCDEDCDGDGLTNAQEKELGTDMMSSDSDGDGLTDSQEVNEYGTDPNNTDTDSDGFSDYDEVQADTDPMDENSPGEGGTIEIPVETEEDIEIGYPSDDEDNNVKISNVTVNRYAGEGKTAVSVGGYNGNSKKTGVLDEIRVSGSGDIGSVSFDYTWTGITPADCAIYYFDPELGYLVSVPGATLDDVSGTISLPGYGAYYLVDKETYEALFAAAAEDTDVKDIEKLKDLDFVVNVRSNYLTWLSGNWESSTEVGSGHTATAMDEAIYGVAGVIRNADHSSLYIGKNGTYVGMNLPETGETSIESSAGNAQTVAQTLITNGIAEYNAFDVDAFNTGYWGQWVSGKKTPMGSTSGVESGEGYIHPTFRGYSASLVSYFFFNITTDEVAQTFEGNESTYIDSNSQTEVRIIIGKEFEAYGSTPTARPITDAGKGQTYHIQPSDDISGVQWSDGQGAQANENGYAREVLLVGPDATAEQIEQMIIDSILTVLSGSTADYTTDSNNDGISDYDTQRIFDGKLLDWDGENPFGEDATFEDVQADTDGDWDNDGLVNGTEISVVSRDFDFSVSTVSAANDKEIAPVGASYNLASTGAETKKIDCLSSKSDCDVVDTDFDGIPDGMEKVELRRNNVTNLEVFQYNKNNNTRSFTYPDYNYKFNTNWFIEGSKSYSNPKEVNFELSNVMMLLAALAYRNNNPCTCTTAQQKAVCNHDRSCNEAIDFNSLDNSAYNGGIMQWFEMLDCNKTQAFSLWSRDYGDTSLDTAALKDDPHRGQAYFALKKVPYTDANGTKKEKYLVFCIVRGTWGSSEEWISNAAIGANAKGLNYTGNPDYYRFGGAKVADWTNPDAAMGFDIYATRVYKELMNEFMQGIPSDADVSFLVSGHSRGAATANLVAQKLIDQNTATSGADYTSALPRNKFTNSDVYAYTFATPNSVEANNPDTSSFYKLPDLTPKLWSNTDVMAHGIDISHHQNDAGAIDWQKVASYRINANDPATKISYVIIKAQEGTDSKDPKFEENYQNAKANHLNVGAYVYSHATTVEKAREEATALLETLKGKTFEYPIYMDFEHEDSKKLSSEDKVKVIKAFAKVLSDAGYVPGLYASYQDYDGLPGLNSQGVMEEYKYRDLCLGEEGRQELVDAGIQLWVQRYYHGENNSYATYGNTSEGNGRKCPYNMWQYTQTGVVDGIKGKVDLNVCYVDYTKYMVNGGFNGYADEDAPSVNPLASRYDSIKNIVSSEDVVTLVPLEQWGFARYGEDIPFNAQSWYISEYNSSFNADNQWNPFNASQLRDIEDLLGSFAITRDMLYVNTGEWDYKFCDSVEEANELVNRIPSYVRAMAGIQVDAEDDIVYYTTGAYMGTLIVNCMGSPSAAGAFTDVAMNQMWQGDSKITSTANGKIYVHYPDMHYMEWKMMTFLGKFFLPSNNPASPNVKMCAHQPGGYLIWTCNMSR